MPKRLQDIDGIGPKYLALLKQHDIDSTEKFLEACGNCYGRKGLSEKTSINENNILKWVNVCDLFRIKGIAGQYVVLLQAAGVDSLQALCTRDPEILALMMSEANKEKRICTITPGPNTVAKWVKQAKQLRCMVTK